MTGPDKHLCTDYELCAACWQCGGCCDCEPGPGIGPDYGWHRELTEDIAPDKEDMRYLP